MHPSKSCFAIQVSPTELTILFLKQRQADQVFLTFNKSLKILSFSFCLGDDFNFMVCTNNMITLYDIKIGKQKNKTVKQIPIQN